MKQFRISLVVVILCASLGGSAQSDSTGNTKPSFRIGIYHTTALHYYGRTDSLRSSGYFPMAELWCNKSFYINAAPVFVHNDATRLSYAGTVATIGNFYVGTRFNNHSYLMVPVYRDNSTLVQSALRAQLSSATTLKTSLVNITAGGDLRWSGHLDYGVSGMMDRAWRWVLPGSVVMVADPSISVNAGTQEISRTYYEKRNGFPLFPGGEEAVTKAAQAFNILSWECGIPLVVQRGKWQVIINPAFVAPQNLVRGANNSDPVEQGSNLFYVTMGCKLVL